MMLPRESRHSEVRCLFRSVISARLPLVRYCRAESVLRRDDAIVREAHSLPGHVSAASVGLNPFFVAIASASIRRSSTSFWVQDETSDTPTMVYVLALSSVSLSMFAVADSSPSSSRMSASASRMGKSSPNALRTSATNWAILRRSDPDMKRRCTATWNAAFTIAPESMPPVRFTSALKRVLSSGRRRIVARSSNPIRVAGPGDCEPPRRKDSLRRFRIAT